MKMASKVTNEDILRINELYYKHKTYAEVARQTGFAASTVKKYVIKDWKPVEKRNIVKFDLADLPDFTSAAELFRGINNYGNLCSLTDYEREQMKELWEEMPI
jgi:hypothetical protein